MLDVCGGVGGKSALMVAMPFLMLFFLPANNGNFVGCLIACFEELKVKLNLKWLKEG